MLEENYLNIKSVSRVSEDSISFIVEDLKFQIAIKINLDNFEISIKELSSGATYISKKTLSEFLKNEIFKGSQNCQTIKEIIFKILINNLAKITFNHNKCYLYLGIKSSSNNIILGINNNSNKDLNYILEFQEDTDVHAVVQNFLKKTEEIEKENKILKFELDKVRTEFANFKEEKNKEIKELKENETERKNDFQILKNQMEKLTILVSSAINNTAAFNNANLISSSSTGNINTNSEDKNKGTNKFLNSFANNLSKNNQILNVQTTKNNNTNARNDSPNLDLNREKTKSSENFLEKNLNNNINLVKTHSNNNNIYDNILMQNILNPKKINLNSNGERRKSPTSDSPPISIRRQVEEMSNKHNRNSSTASPLNNHSNSEGMNIINSSPISNNNSQKRISNLVNIEKVGNNSGNINPINYNQTGNFFRGLMNNKNNISSAQNNNNNLSLGNLVSSGAINRKEEVKNNLYEKSEDLKGNNEYNVNYLNNHLLNPGYNSNNLISNEKINNNINSNLITNNNNKLNNINVNTNPMLNSINNNPLFTFSNNIQTPKSIQDYNYINNIINNNLSNINSHPNNNINNNENNKNFINQNYQNLPTKGNELLNFINENPVNMPTPYKYMDLILKKPISDFKLENNIKFFYQVNKGELSETTLWSPFDEEDCILLELHYPNYLIGGPSEIYLERLDKLVNFKYMMLVDAENSENHIHIKRSLPNKLENIIRKSRYNFEDLLSEENLKHKVIPSINILKDYNKYQEYFVSFEFGFIKNHNFEVKIPKKFEYLYRECIKRSNYGGFVVSLREEMEILRRLYGKRNSIYLNYIDNLENSPKFFQIIIQMYTEDGFLNKELNKILRKPNLEKLNRIKYFYLAVLVSLTYCSLNVRPKIGFENSQQINNIKSKSNGFNGLKENQNNEHEKFVKTEASIGGKYKKTEKNNEHIIDKSVTEDITTPNPNVGFITERNYFIYSPYLLSTDELNFYKENQFNILFFDEFLSATPNKSKAENYIKAFKSMEINSKIYSFKNDNTEDQNNFSNGINKNVNFEMDGENNKPNESVEEDGIIDQNNLSSNNHNSKKNSNRNKVNSKENNKNYISVILEIEVPYYMLENENMHLDSIAFAYQQNFSLYPQDEEVILKSGSILMLKDIVQNNKEVYQFTIKLVMLSFSWKGFFDCLAYNITTKEINLNKNGIGNFRKSVKYLCEALVKNKNIEKLCLRENHFGENFESMKYLSNLISISNFSLSTNNQEILEKLNSQQENNLNNSENIRFLNYFNITNQIYLNSIPKLKILDLSSNAMGKDAKIAKLFCDALSINQNLKQIDLSNNNFNDIDSAKALASALVSNKFLEILDLSNNNLGANLLSMNYISEALLLNQTIHSLNLAENNLGERADIVKNLSDSFSRIKTIKKLNLSGNAFGINSISVRYLAEGLILNESIIELDLKNNLLGNMESISYLCALLEKNEIIEILDLTKNKFGINKESYTLLGDAISQNRKIHTLNLSNNNLNTHLDYLRSLLDSLRMNNKLRKIYLSYNSLSNNEDFKMFVKSMLKDRNINYLGTSEI